MKPKKLKKAKVKKAVFSPKKVQISKARKQSPGKFPKGDHYGKKWYPE